MQLLENDRIKEFVLGGNALITLESGKTGCHFTYKITKSKNDENLYFIKNLRGSDNQNDYVYVGCFFADTRQFVVEKSYRDKDVNSWPKSIRAIRYLFNNLDDVPYLLHVFHNGKCCRCGRTLTTPESIRRGIGPECERSKR
jgi:hypothetical protein